MTLSVTMVGPTLYKRGTKGEIREWRMELGVDEATGTAGHRVISGIQGGAMTESAWNLAEGKNLGKKNATTPLTQAEAEIENTYTIKLDGSYFTDVEDVDQVKFTKPMLATDWEKRKAKADLGSSSFSQPKLDGIRCIARIDGLWTRTGKPIVSAPHIMEQLEPLFHADPDLELDGELYNHVLKDDFNTITSLVRKENLSDEDLSRSRELVQYHVYDLPSHPGTFGERSRALHHLVQNMMPVVQFVATVEIVVDENFHATLDRLFGEYLADGYEGQMVRLDDIYENKRSNMLMKRKEFDTAEFPVIGMSEGSGNWAGCIKTFTVALADDTPNEATLRGKQVDLRKLLLDGTMPKWATVRFFGYTPDGKLRFPIAIDWGFTERQD